jgi:hypothetical protein
MGQVGDKLGPEVGLEAGVVFYPRFGGSIFAYLIQATIVFHACSVCAGSDWTSRATSECEFNMHGSSHISGAA